MLCKCQDLWLLPFHHGWLSIKRIDVLHENALTDNSPFANERDLYTLSHAVIADESDQVETFQTKSTQGLPQKTSQKE